MFGRQSRAVTAVLLERVEAGRDAGGAARARTRDDREGSGDEDDHTGTRTRPGYDEMSLEELLDPAVDPEGGET